MVLEVVNSNGIGLVHMDLGLEIPFGVWLCYQSTLLVLNVLNAVNLSLNLN